MQYVSDCTSPHFAFSMIYALVVGSQPNAHMNNVSQILHFMIFSDFKWSPEKCNNWDLLYLLLLNVNRNQQYEIKPSAQFSTVKMKFLTLTSISTAPLLVHIDHTHHLHLSW